MTRQFRNDAEVDLYRCAVMLKSIAASLEELVKLEKQKHAKPKARPKPSSKPGTKSN
jgi:hypothetical protein